MKSPPPPPRDLPFTCVDLSLLFVATVFPHQKLRHDSGCLAVRIINWLDWSPDTVSQIPLKAISVVAERALALCFTFRRLLLHASRAAIFLHWTLR